MVAADLLAQSEHDVNAKGILLTTDEAFGKSVIEAVEEELKILDTAKDCETVLGYVWRRSAW